MHMLCYSVTISVIYISLFALQVPSMSTRDFAIVSLYPYFYFTYGNQI